MAIASESSERGESQRLNQQLLEKRQGHLRMQKGDTIRLPRLKITCRFYEETLVYALA